MANKHMCDFGQIFLYGSRFQDILGFSGNNPFNIETTEKN